MESGTLAFCRSADAVEEEGGSWTSSGAGGTWSEGLMLVAGVVAGVGIMAPGGGGCEEGLGPVSADTEGFF